MTAAWEWRDVLALAAVAAAGAAAGIGAVTVGGGEVVAGVAAGVAAGGLWTTWCWRRGWV